MADFELAFPITMRHEGGFVDDPDDPGGITNRGVTARMWEAWKGRMVTVEEMKALTVEDVKPFYKARFWDVLGLGKEEDQGRANSLFDFFVNVSPKTFHEVVIAAAPLTSDSLFREKIRHYLAECRRRRKKLPPEKADKFLLNWCERALEMVTR